jgi:hypothetical protein
MGGRFSVLRNEPAPPPTDLSDEFSAASNEPAPPPRDPAQNDEPIEAGFPQEANEDIENQQEQEADEPQQNIEPPAPPQANNDPEAKIPEEADNSIGPREQKEDNDHADSTSDEEEIRICECDNCQQIDRRGWATSLNQPPAYHCFIGTMTRAASIALNETERPSTPEIVANTHNRRYLTSLFSTKKRRITATNCPRNNDNDTNNFHEIDRTLQQEINEQEGGYADTVYFPRGNAQTDNERQQRAPQVGDTVIVQVTYKSDTRCRYYRLRLFTDHWDRLPKRDAELCGTIPTELLYIDEFTNRAVFCVGDLTLTKGSLVTEDGKVLQTYTGRVYAKKQPLTHVEVRDPFRRSGGRHYYLPPYTTIEMLKEMHGHENSEWVCQVSRDTLTQQYNREIRTLDTRGRRGKRFACVVVLESVLDASDAETTDNSGSSSSDDYPSKRQKTIHDCPRS